MHKPRTQKSPAAQRIPQAPQFVGSLCASTHAFMQLVVPVGHAHTPAVHGTVPGHRLPQRPHWVRSVCVFTQAFRHAV